MTANLKNFNSNHTMDPKIQLHPGWHGHISGLQAQDKLVGHGPYVYLLREGEDPSNYYVSYVNSDLSIQHQPFMIRFTPHGWCCRNGTGTGPFINQTIQDIIHLIMHCKEEECIPLQNTNNT